jgi:hypothetical protein
MENGGLQTATIRGVFVTGTKWVVLVIFLAATLFFLWIMSKKWKQ